MTLYTGIKLTHDAAIAQIENGRLTLCYEAEKIGNAKRHATFANMAEAISLLDGAPTGHIAVDGWKEFEAQGLPVAGYHEQASEFYEGPLTRYSFAGYSSHMHLTNHVLGSVAMSPFDACNVLVWDGGTSPRIYFVSKQGHLEYRGSPFHYYGYLYSIMNYYFGPFKKAGWERDWRQKQFGQYSWPGKIMSYYTRGRPKDDFLDIVKTKFTIYSTSYDRTRGLSYIQDGAPEHTFCAAVRAIADEDGVSDEDCLAAIHIAIEQGLLAGLDLHAVPHLPLVFTGGSALNIKWNSAIRKAGWKLFVPPVPNDSGSAIGAAVSERFFREGKLHIDWDVYCGPDLIRDSPGLGWERSSASVHDIAGLIADDWIVCVLHGRAEIGPRALGSRSLIASPLSSVMKDRLNAAKRREAWRPVAPIVKEHRVGTHFRPGTPDPYMLFDHVATERTRINAPAIVHEDGTARVQTLSPEQNIITYQILDAFHSFTGVPIVCNTSANFLGKGFFPSISSACLWAQETNDCRHVWDGDNNVLWTR